MRSIENSGLGATTPVFMQPGRPPIARMLYSGGQCGPGAAPQSIHELFRKSIGLQTCDDEGSGIRCQSATPVSAMHGLGGLGVLGCKSLDLAKDGLKQTLAVAEKNGYTGPEYTAAVNSAIWDIAVVIPYIGNDCAQYTLEAQRLDSNLRAALPSFAKNELPPMSGSLDTTDATNKTADTIKAVAIAGGISVAVIGVIYLVGPFVRSLAKAGARAVR